MTPGDSPCSTSHKRTVPSSLPLSSLRLSEEKAKLFTTGRWPCSAALELLSSPTHRRRLCAKLLLASRLPSGAKARQRGPLVCHHVQSKARLSTSHSLTLLSRLPLASVHSSGLKAIDVTMSVWACQTRCKIWPASRHTRTSPRWLAAAQYCPLRLMAAAVIASKASVKTHSRIKAPDRVASCSSTPCR